MPTEAQLAVSAKTTPHASTPAPSVKGFVPGVSVEDVSGRDARTKRFNNPDGSTTLSLSLRPQFFQDGRGAWQPVDTGIVADPGVPGGLVSKANTWTAHFGPLPAGVRIDSPEGVLAFSPVGTAPVAPTQSAADTVTYLNAWPGIDLRYLVLGDQVKETVVLNRRPTSATFAFLTAGLGFDPAGAGALAPRRAQSHWTLSAPVILDKSGTPLPDAPVTLTPTGAGPGAGLSLAVSPTWLAAQPDSAFPILVDPTANYLTWNMSSYKSDGTSCGTCGVQVGNPAQANGTFYWRSVAYFNYEQVLGQHVSNATVTVDHQHYGTANSYPFGVWNPTAYSYAGAIGNGQEVSANVGSAGSLTSPGLTGLYDYWVSNRITGGSLGFTGYETPGLYTYKQFDNFYLTLTTAPTAPSPPTNPAATPANNSANITWNLSASDGGAAIDSYAVNAFDGNTGAFITGSTISVCATCTSATMGGLANNYPYYFGVYAHNAVNYSAPAYTATIYPTPPPGPPQGAVATPGNASATMVWAPPVPNGGTAITQYAVLAYYTDNTYSGHLVVVCATCYSGTVTGLANGTAYNLFVTAANPAGWGALAQSGPVTPNVNVPGPPVGPVTWVPGAGSLGVVWYPPASAGTTAISMYALNTYDLATGLVSSIPVTCSPCGAGVFTAVTGLVTGHSYFVAVYAYNNAGFGPAAITAVSGPNPAAPGPSSAVVATAANTAATAIWVPPVAGGTSAIDNYLLEALDQADATAVYATITCPCTNPATGSIPGLTNGHSYQVGVFAHNAAGYGSPGVSNLVTPGAADPTVLAGNRPDFMPATVNVGTGNLEITMSDLSLPAVGGRLGLGRTYNSLSQAVGSSAPYSGSFGYGWHANQTDVRLIANNDGTVTFQTPSGSSQIFGPGPTYSAPPGADATLVKNGDGSYTLTGHASAEVLSFGPAGQLVSDADRNHNTVTYSYRQTSLAGTAGTAPGNTANLVYTGQNGHVSSMSETADAVTRTVSYTYDLADNLYQVTDTAGRVTTFGYDVGHNLTQITGPAPIGAVTQFGYDGAHRVTTITRVVPGGTNTVTGYDYSTPGHTKVTDADNHPPVDHTVDASGRVTAVTDAFGHTATVTWGADAKVTNTRTPSGAQSTNTWGANSGESLTGTTNAIGATSQANYANTGLLAWSADWTAGAMANRTNLSYDPVANRMSATDVATGAKTTATYNPDGTVASTTQPNNVTTPQNPARSTQYAYTNHQPVSVTPPQGSSLGATSTSYDGAGRPKTATTAKGITATSAYDALDRVTTTTFSDATPAISVVYDAAGQVTSRSDASGTTGYTFDVLGRLVTKTLPGGAVLRYGYDNVGNLVSATDTAGTTTYHYDKANRLDQLTEPGGRTDIFAYDMDGNRSDTWNATNTGVTYDATGNTIVAPTGFAAHTRSTYDGAGNLTEIKTTRASSDLDINRVADTTYTYTVANPTSCPGETAGMVTDQKQTSTALGFTVPGLPAVTSQTTTYCDDPMGRLTQAATAGGSTYNYGWDADTNRTSDAAGTHTFNTGDQLTDAGFSYDANGNQTSSPRQPIAAYNSLDQTTSITPAGASAVPFAYAGSGQSERTLAGATTAQNGISGITNETTGGATTSYIREPGGALVAERTPSGDFYYYFDGIGSVIGLIDPAGNQRAAYTYDPFGANATATAIGGTLPPNPWRFQGGYLDAATGLYHFGERYYDPTLGRFLQVDPVEGGSANDYDYAFGDPINNTDLSGTCVEDACVGEALIAEALIIYGIHSLFGHRAYHPPPRILPAFPDAQRVRPKTGRYRWEDNDYIYEWDSQHARVEKYSKKTGQHLGEFDPKTGKQTKPPKKGRRTVR